MTDRLTDSQYTDSVNKTTLHATHSSQRNTGRQTDEEYDKPLPAKASQPAALTQPRPVLLIASRPTRHGCEAVG